MHFDFELELAHPIAQVFSFLGEPGNRPRWQSSLRCIERLTEGPPGVGTRWRESPFAVGSYEMSIIEYERDRAWAESFQGAAASGTVRMLFASNERRGTKVRVVGKIQLKGIWRWSEPLVRRLLPLAMRRDLGAVDALLARERT